MATHKTVAIPFTRLIKIGIWSNYESKTTMANIYKTLQTKYPGKEVYIANAGLFDMTSFKAIFGLKSNGTVYSNAWNICFMGMKGNTIKFCSAGSSVEPYTDAVSGYPALIENGKKSSNFSYCLDNSDRGRTMLGYNDTSVILSCIADTSGNSDFTMDEEVTYMLSQKCKYAINLDGGGSSQCNFNGSTITSSRKVNNFVYMIVEPVTVANNTTTTVTTSSYSVGSVIKLKTGATYTNGKAIPSWVFKSTLYCRKIGSSGAVTFSTQKAGAITGTVDARFVEGTTSNSSVSSTVTSNVATPTSVTVSYAVQVTCNVLNIRSGPSTAYKITGTAKKGEKYTVTETLNGWGKTSKGWISLSYTKKV